MSVTAIIHSRTEEENREEYQKPLLDFISVACTLHIHQLFAGVVIGIRCCLLDEVERERKRI